MIRELNHLKLRHYLIDLNDLLQLVDIGRSFLYTYESAFRKRFHISWILNEYSTLRQR